MSISNKAKQHADSCRFCWMCRHVCPVGLADGQERNNARARALMVSLVNRDLVKLDEVADNIYECTLCGACTNNCVTGWDPKIFIQEMKTEITLNGVLPSYILELVQKQLEDGTIYSSSRADIYSHDGKSLVLFGLNAVYNDHANVNRVIELLTKAGVDVATSKASEDTGYTLYFLTGKTQETVEQTKKCVAELNKYDEVIVYNPVELSYLLHQAKEWGLELTTKVLSFEDKVLELVKANAIKLAKTEAQYTLQDNYAYTRELDDRNTGRQIISLCGENKEMLLHGKVANYSGSLIMSLYMPSKMLDIARNRWTNALNMGCTTLVTQNTDEYVLLTQTAPEGCKVLSIEELILTHME